MAWVALGAAMSWGVLKQRRLRHFTLQAKKDHSLHIVVGDLIHNLAKVPEASCAFGVNDTFSVHGLKKGSAHQDFMDAFFGDRSTDENQASLDAALVRSNPSHETAHGVGLDRTAAAARRPRLPLGTIACLPFATAADGQDRHAFLLANSSAVTHGFRGQGRSQDLIGKIWDYHRSHGMVSDKLVVTLIGNGHAGDMDPMSAARSLIDWYYRHLQETPVNEVSVRNLFISIRPEVVNTASVDLEVIHGYARARNKLFRALLV